jgi:iron complex transport system substrate-binding protein
VCLSAEAAQICWYLGIWDQVVGVSAFAPVYQPLKPICYGFSSGRLNQVLELKPDLVLTFSDVQAVVAQELIQAGVPVWAWNYDRLAGVERAIRDLGALTGASTKAEEVVQRFWAGLKAVSAASDLLKPRIYFEEWPDPPIAGINWIGEIIQLAGGDPLFWPSETKASNRMVTDAQIVQFDPDIILVSWCGRRFDREKFVNRPGLSALRPARTGDIYELEGADILQAGPELVRGAERIRRIIAGWRSRLRATAAVAGCWPSAEPGASIDPPC